MTSTKEGYICPKCGFSKIVKPEIHIVREKATDKSSIYVLGESTTDHSKVSRQCPDCGNNEAFYWFSGVAGEHAGIRQERTMQHFKCTKCGHSWTAES
jgi:DNA-directed RNA polymerase subunit M/transcription elongation factor TFIIS